MNATMYRVAITAVGMKAAESAAIEEGPLDLIEKGVLARVF
jgi:hypothetical protein